MQAACFRLQRCFGMTCQSACRTPACRIKSFVMLLSMHALEAATPEPTKGSPAICKSPCKEPSSPFSPWMSGKTTSMRSRTTQSFSKRKSP